MAMDEWRYDTASDLDQTITERLRRFPREPDMMMYGIRSLAALGIRAWLRTYHRLEMIGREYLPTEGSYVLVGNHTSHLDCLCLLSILPWRKVHRACPAAATDYFFTSALRITVGAVVMNALPFDRQIFRFRQSLRLCKEVLANPGNVLIIFPEGTRSVTGEIEEFKPGIGLLLAGANVPVLPCHLAGAFEALPKGRVLPQPVRLRLMIGAPRNFAALPPGKSSALRVCQELRQAVLELAAVNRKKSSPAETIHPADRSHLGHPLPSGADLREGWRERRFPFFGVGHLRRVFKSDKNPFAAACE
ncbi:MAG: lysophospholipid acyltransferase family protein [Nitrospinota bacterium]